MASLANRVWFLSSVQYTSVTAWAANTAKTVGNLIRQNTAPTVGNERVFVCIVAGTTSNPTEPTWVVTKGAKTTDNTVTWQECTGQSAVNGDTTDTPAWASASATVLGQVIKNIAGTGIFICSTSSGNTGGSQPAGLATPVLGATTADGSNVWTCISASPPFANWAAPHARATALTTANWSTTGDTNYIADNHAETQTVSNSLKFLGSTSAPCIFLCVDHTKLPPYAAGDLKTTATMTSTTGSFSISPVSSVGYAYIYGVSFSSAGGSAVSVNAEFARLDSCQFKPSANVVSLGGYQGSGSGARVELYNPIFNFTANTGSCQLNGGNVYVNGLTLAGTAPTNFLTNTSSQNSTNAIFEGADLSTMASSSTIVTAIGLPHQIQFLNCKMPASFTLATAPTDPHSARIVSIASSNTTTVVDTRVSCFEGAMTTDTGVVVTTGGATDGNTPYSWKIVTTAGANSSFLANAGAFFDPFETPPLAELNVVAGAFKTGASITATVQIASATAGLTNADVWLEAEYMGSSATPISTRLSTGVATILSTGSALAAGVAWNSSPGNTYTISLAMTSPNISLNGLIRFVVKVGKPSITVYVDPKVTLS